MKDYLLSQRFSIVGLDGLDSTYPSMSKTAVLRGIMAAQCVESLLNDGVDSDISTFLSSLETKVNEIQKQGKKFLKTVEQEVASSLMYDGALEEIPGLLACDMNYTTSGINIKVYRSCEDIYRRITEEIRAEILEDGEITLECMVLMWLLRESGCIHDLFSIAEQQKVQERLISISANNPLYRGIFGLEFHKGIEIMAANSLRFKSNLFKNPYLQGINLLFPFLERKQAIFIDFVILGTTVKDRRVSVLSYLSEKGHYVEEVADGEETLLKIDNSYYRIFPYARGSGRIPIQGINLVPAYK